MPDRGSATIKINAIAYYGMQGSVSVTTTDNANTSASYALNVGKFASSSGIVPVLYNNQNYRGGAVKINDVPYYGMQGSISVNTGVNVDINTSYLINLGKSASSNGIVPTVYNLQSYRGSIKLNSENYPGVQTAKNLPNQDGTTSNASYISSVGRSSPNSGFYSSSTETWRGNDGYEGDRPSIVTPYSQTQLNAALSLGVRYYTMWGLDVGNTPRSWTVTNQPDTTGSQSGYSMNVSTIRIINFWST